MHLAPEEKDAPNSVKEAVPGPIRKRPLRK